MDVPTVAKDFGPRLRADGLIMVALGFVGAIAFACVRIVRDGSVDGWSVFWIAVAIVWGLSALGVEFAANRLVARAARDDRRSTGARVILLRFGQFSQVATAEATRSVNKAWIAVGKDELLITAYRRRELVGRYDRQDIVAVRAIGGPKSYGVLELDFADGARFASIPVQTGIRNVGLPLSGVSRIAADIEAWRQQSTHHPRRH